MPRDAANHPRAVSGAWRRLEALARRPTLRQVALLQVGAAAIAAIGFVSSAAMARLLGSSEFGLYALALSALSLSGIVVDLGQATGAVIMDLTFTDGKLGHVLLSSTVKAENSPKEVRRTADGGKSWKSLGDLMSPGDVHGLSFPSANHGYPACGVPKTRSLKLWSLCVW